MQKKKNKKLRQEMNINAQRYHTSGISSMSTSFSCSTIQFAAASRLALPEKQNGNNNGIVHNIDII